MRKLILLIPLLLLAAAFAVPQVKPLYGLISSGGVNSSVSTIISGRINGVEKGSFNLTIAGRYGGPGLDDGKLTITGTESDLGETIYFSIKTPNMTGYNINATQTHVWSNNNPEELNLTYPVDPTPPTNSSLISPTSLTYQNTTPNVTLSSIGSCSDASYGLHAYVPYQVAFSDTSTSADANCNDNNYTGFGWGNSTNITFSGTTDHYYCIQLQCQDAAGNVAYFNSTAQVLYDVTPPTGTSTTLSNQRNTIYLNGTSNDTGSGVASVNITATNVSGGVSSWSSVNGTTTWFASNATTIADGYYYITLRVTDLAGNTFDFNTTTRIDNTAPSGASITSSNQRNTIYLNGTSNDTGSGVASVNITATNTTGGISDWSAISGTTTWFATNGTAISDGYYYVTIRVTDAAGNTYDFNTTTRIDNTAPTTSDSGTDSSWHTSAVSINLTCSDAGSGCSATYYCVDQAGSCTPSTAYTTTISISTGGVNYLRFYSTDSVGNNETIKNATNTIKFDSTVPAGGSVSGSSYARSSVNLTVTNATDSESGISTSVLQRANATLAADSCGSFGNWINVATSVSASYTDSLTGGLCYKYRLNSTNAAGLSNTSSESSTIKSDTTAPSLSLFSPTNTTYTTASVSISYSAGDAHTSVSTIQYSDNGAANVTLFGDTSVSFSETQHTLVLYATDAAGNIASQSVVFIVTTIDSTPPSAVTGLAAANTTSQTGGELRLTWAAATDAFGVSSYKIYRNTTNFTSVQFLSPIATTTSLSYNDTGLTNGQTYYYAVTAVDPTGNENKTVVALSAAPGDIVAPTISSVSVTDVSHESATITWATNEAGTSVVYYGLTSSYGSSATGANGTTHNVALANLTNSTTYFFKVSSADSSGNIANGTGYNFTTAARYVNNSVTAPANTTTLINATASQVNATLEVTTNSTTTGSVNVTQSGETPANRTINDDQTSTIPLTYLDIDSSLNSTSIPSIRIVVYYTDEELAALGIDEASLLIYWFNETSGEWIPLSTSVDFVLATGQNTTTNYIWANVTHFSFYGLGGKKANGLSCTSAVSCSSGSCVHGTCRSGSYYSGDGFCDSGETCSNSVDCGTCTTTTTTGGGGTTGTEIVPESRETITLLSLSAGEATALTFEKATIHAIRKITIEAKKTLDNIQLTISKLTEKPSDAKSEAGKSVFSYFSIVKTINNDDLKEVTFQFEVPVNWLETNQLNKNSIAMLRLEGSDWNKLPTELVSEDQTYLYYKATSPGFSTFAIAAVEAVSTKPTFWEVLDSIDQYFAGKLSFWELLTKIDKYFA